MKKEKRNKKPISKNKQESNKKPLYFTAGAILIFFLLVFWLVVMPDVRRIYRIKNEFEKEKMLFEIDKENVTKAPEYNKLISGIDDDKQLLDQSTINKDQQVEFIRSIEEISRLVKMDIKISNSSQPKTNVAINPPTADPEKGNQEGQEKKEKPVSLLLKLGGSYQSFLNFYYRLENMPYLFEINSIELNKLEEKWDDGSPSELSAGEIEADVVISFTPK